MFRLGGHVITPLIGLMKRHETAMPTNFNAKSKCIPEWGAVREQLEEDFAEIQEKVRKKCDPRKEDKDLETQNLGRRMAWHKVEEEYQRILSDNKDAVKEETVYGWKRKLEGFIVAPIDKHSGECCVI